MKALSFAMLVCAAGLAACASGGGDRGRAAGEPVRALMSADVMMFVSFDSDGDLRLTAAEREAGIEREFTRADSSRDGQLQPLEFQTWSGQVLGGTILGPFRLDFDRNVDNVITRDEFVTEIRARFTEYDSNEDEVLERSEFIRLIDRARPAQQRRRTPYPDGDPST